MWMKNMSLRILNKFYNVMEKQKWLMQWISSWTRFKGQLVGDDSLPTFLLRIKVICTILYVNIDLCLWMVDACLVVSSHNWTI